MIRIATWNINSVRLRIENVARLAKETNADIICLQETKTPNEYFPLEFVENLGYKYNLIHGEKSYNGVAILSRLPLVEEHKLYFDEKGLSTRHVACKILGNIELHNFYIPAGGDDPDPKVNLKFAEKLQYLDRLIAWLKNERSENDNMIIVGDINTAPLPNDVWSHTQLLKVISHTPIEIEKMDLFQKSLDLVDVSRHFVDASKKLYSWWSYRNKDWRKSDRGRRLDHIWVTKPLKPRLHHSFIMKDARDWHLPSDHVPVVVDLMLT